MPLDEALQLYSGLLRVRLTELRLAELYKEQEMRTPTHFGVGQEAVAVGVCSALQQGDVVYSHHRCHNHYLACGGDLFELAAELYGREGGCSRGRGGSVHLTAREKGFIVSSAILGETIACAAGSALAFQMDRKPHVAVSFFGDAACEEGVSHESFNYASVHRLPVLFVCENNLYSTESPTHVRQPQGLDLCERARSYRMQASRHDGNDVFTVIAATREALEVVRAGEGPYFLELMTYRWLEHVGPHFDHEMGRDYRSREELEDWMARDPLLRTERQLLEMGADAAELARRRQETADEIEDAVTRAKADTWPAPNDLYAHI